MFDVEKIKKDFPILKRQVNGKSLVYLDNAATSQKPLSVIKSISDYYENHNANVHRGVHMLSEEATDLYEKARETVAHFIGARSPSEVIFTQGSTESINRVAFSFLSQYLKQGDQVMVVDVDHHSNLVPWQVVCKGLGAEIVPLSVDESGLFDMKDFKNKLSDKVKFISISHVSNVLGTIFPVKEVCSMARKHGIIVSVDGAQAIPHIPVNVSDLGCDFYAFSAHKMLGPMGIGVLWGRKEILEKMSPYEFGGGMIKKVTLEESTWGEIPERFEAGTPNVSGAVGLASAITYLNNLGMSDVEKHEKELTAYALNRLIELPKIQILGPKEPTSRSGLVSFNIPGAHSHDVAAVLNSEGIAVRSGQHCTMPLHNNLRISSSVRASFYVYNDLSDIDALLESLDKVRKILL